ncbi:MAG: hypothetical protein NTZ17_07250 [Phycisphaerae bacterium]|nr:hypothetical protein [Phycisphaerae bacterium]
MQRCRSVSTMVRSSLTILFWMAILVPGLWLGVARAAITVTKTAVHDPCDAYGLELTTGALPRTNDQAISLSVSGATTGFPDVSFGASGLYANANLVNTGPTINVTAVGGTATADDWVSALIRKAFGLSTEAATVNNSANITVTATGGTAEINDDSTANSVQADAGAKAVGIYAQDDSNDLNISDVSVTNTGDITVTATGGKANATADPDTGFTQAYATGETHAAGIAAVEDVFNNVNISNTGAIAVTATGGTVDAIADANDGDAYAYANGETGAVGIAVANGDFNNVTIANEGAVTVSAKGGTGNAHADTNNGTAYATTGAGEANAAGITVAPDGGDVNDVAITNKGAIAVTATGGTADANATTVRGYANANADASAEAAGINATNGDFNDVTITNEGAITVTAAGGKANAVADANDSSAYASAYTEADAAGIAVRPDDEIHDVTITNTGAIAVTATGGTADANTNNVRGYASADADASANADGIGVMEGYFNDVSISNTGAITVTATGGTVNAAADANDDSANASANTEAYATGISVMDGEFHDVTITNEGAMTVTATGGTGNAAAAANDGSANASANAAGIGAMEGEFHDVTITNEGAITVTAQGGTANASASADGVADANEADVKKGGSASAGANASTGASGQPYANADAAARASGIIANNGDVNNVGDITVTATGGTAIADAVADVVANAKARASADANGTFAYADAYANASAYASAYASANANANADARGIDAGGDVNNVGDITVIATGGIASADANLANVNAVADAAANANADANDVYGNAEAIGGAGASTSVNAYANANANASAVGIEAGGDVNNVGAITVTATGGTADANDYVNANANASAVAKASADANDVNGGTEAYAGGDEGPLYASAGASAYANNATANANASAYGIRAGGDVNNVGAIAVTATGGTANANARAGAAADAVADAGAVADTALTADAYADADASNTNATAQADAQASAGAEAYGIQAYDDSEPGYEMTGPADVNNTGAITVKATGGTADAIAVAEGNADADAVASANNADDAAAASANNTNAYAYASADADASTEAEGIVANGNVNNVGAITVLAMGGTANASADANAVASGYAKADANDTYANAYAQEGYANASANASANANADAYGIDAGGDVINTGDILVLADANDAHASATAYAKGDANDVGVQDNAYSDVDADANANANANANASASGIRTYNAEDSQLELEGHGDVNNTGAITVAAAGGLAYADANIPDVNSPDGNAVTNSEAVAQANGTARDDANAYAYANANANAYAEAYGIDAAGNVTNTGVINVSATGGIAYADANTPDVNAPAGNTKAQASSEADANTDTFRRSNAYASSNAEANASAEAGGISANGNVNNVGTINVTATGGTADARGRAGADAFADDQAETAANAYANAYATASANADAEAGGIWAGGDVNNVGAINVTSRGGTASATAGTNANARAAADVDLLADDTANADASSNANAYADASAFGIGAEGDVDNAGAINVMASGGTADANALGAAAAFAEGKRGTRSSSTYAEADASAEAAGIGAKGDVHNVGTINVTATGGVALANADDNAYADAHASAVGIAAGFSGFDEDLQGSADVNNTGAITVIATGGTANANANADAYGIAAPRFVNNTGDVTVTATGGMASADVDADRNDDEDARVNAKAYGIYYSHADFDGDFDGDVHPGVNNTGNLTVTAVAGKGFESRAYGIYMDGSGEVTNTGTIRVSADRAYQLYVNSGTTTLVRTFNVLLDGDPEKPPIGVADNATLALNNATLTVAADSKKTLWGRQYELFELKGEDGRVEGRFDEAKALNPNTSVLYNDQDTFNSADDTVALAYAPVAATPLASGVVERQMMGQAVDTVNQHMTSLLLQNLVSPPTFGLLADEGSTHQSFLVDAGSTDSSLSVAGTAARKSPGLFVEPYYSWLDKDADPLGFKSRLWGFSLGYAQYVGNSLLGLHAGYGEANIDYTGTGFNSNSEEQKVVSGGFTGLTVWDPWTLRYGLDGFYGNHDYEGLTGLSLEERETASYNSYGTAATLMAGHIFRSGSHVFLPEAGLNWLWVDREPYTTDGTNPHWNTTYSGVNENDLLAAAAIRWLTTFTRDETSISPSVAVGVRHLLTDDVVSVLQSVNGVNPVVVESERDRTALTLSGALTLARTPHVLSLAYDGEFSSEAKQHSVWLRYGWSF